MYFGLGLYGFGFRYFRFGVQVLDFIPSLSSAITVPYILIKKAHEILPIYLDFEFKFIFSLKKLALFGSVS
jgi:hypothetical protein